MTARSEHEAQASEGTASYRLAGVVYKGEAEPIQGKLCKQGWLATMSRASYSDGTEAPDKECPPA